MFGSPPFALIGRVPPTLVNLMPKFGAYLTSRLALVAAISGLVIGALAYGAGVTILFFSYVIRLSTLFCIFAPFSGTPSV